MEDSGGADVRYTLNLSRLQVWTAFIGSLFAILGIIGGGLVWARGEVQEAIRVVTNDVMDQRLEAIHTDMEPKLYANVSSMIDARIAAHRLAAEEPFDKRLESIENRITALENSLPSLIKAIDRNTDRLDRVLERLSQ